MGHSIGDWNVDGYLDWWMTAIHDDSNRDCKSVGCKFSKAGNVFYANHGNRSLLDVTSHVRLFYRYYKFTVLLKSWFVKIFLLLVEKTAETDVMRFRFITLLTSSSHALQT